MGASTDSRSLEPVDDFRYRARAWLAGNMPLRQVGGVNRERSGRLERMRELQARLFDGGFAGIRFPLGYGGLGLTVEHQQAFLEESAEYELPTGTAISIGILGATLLQFGSEPQKRIHIPRMLRGDELWIQLLSEPGGGSDLAGVTTRATRDGEEYVLNGAKTWSTGAYFSDFGLCLVRTDWNAPKHRGLSMLIVPLHHPGVEIRRIQRVTGDSEICTEFFDDVRISGANLVGEENRGWEVATGLLYHERSFVGGESLAEARYSPRTDVMDVLGLATRFGRSQDPLVRQMVGESLVNAELGRLLSGHILRGIREGQLNAAAASMAKLWTSVSAYRDSEIALDIVGAASAGWSDSDPAYGVSWLDARTPTIVGGANEVQRNQIAERVLQLPREPGNEVGPFNQTLRNSAPSVSTTEDSDFYTPRPRTRS